nr:MAG: hypothetical protein DIU60_20235 [Actinomycetota bacterium]
MARGEEDPADGSARVDSAEENRSDENAEEEKSVTAGSAENTDVESVGEENADEDREADEAGGRESVCSSPSGPRAVPGVVSAESSAAMTSDIESLLRVPLRSDSEFCRNLPPLSPQTSHPAAGARRGGGRKRTSARRRHPVRNGGRGSYAARHAGAD